MKSELLGWRPGLDGLRGVAILMVMLYHFDATHDLFPGGSLGVDIFFVLSGFLITTLLLEERSRTGGIALPGFFRRRARRLLPALVAFLTVFAVVTVVSIQPGASRLPATLLASLFYLFNWIPAFGGSWTPGVGHIWSLSVEEQFYMLWPLAMIIALRSGPRTLLALSLIVFVVSASLSTAWSGRDPGGLYYSTDFRAQELMAGAILALIRFRGALGPSIVESRPFHAAAVLSVLFLGVILFRLEDPAGLLDIRPYALTAVASAVLICACLYAPPRFLTAGVVRYIGTRSYALYLWHNAISYWMRDLGAIPEFALAVGLSFAAAEISWQLIERRGSYMAGLLNRVRERFSASGDESADTRPPIAVQPRPVTSESQH